ncbi:MAG: hypothetical protein H7836_15505 [Magnetococcus sp. YQC-3]
MDFSKKERIDYPSVVFRQLDRIETMFCETSVKGALIGTQEKNIYSAIRGLESLVKFKLIEKELEGLEDEKRYIGFDKVSISKTNLSFENVHDYFELIMKYIMSSNIVPSTRISVDTTESFSGVTDD